MWDPPSRTFENRELCRWSRDRDSTGVFVLPNASTAPRFQNLEVGGIPGNVAHLCLNYPKLRPWRATCAGKSPVAASASRISSGRGLSPRPLYGARGPPGRPHRDRRRPPRQVPPDPPGRRASPDRAPPHDRAAVGRAGGQPPARGQAPARLVQPRRWRGAHLQRFPQVRPHLARPRHRGSHRQAGPRAARLGPGVEAFAARIRRRKVAIKALLLDQTAVAGVGNIYADESLFRRHPSAAKTSTLTDEEVGRLYEACERC